MMFAVTGPKGHIDSKLQIIEAPSIDDAAIGAGSQLDYEITGVMNTFDFRDPKTPREYQYIRHVEGEGDRLVWLKVEPMTVLHVNRQG